MTAALLSEATRGCSKYFCWHFLKSWSVGCWARRRVIFRYILVYRNQDPSFPTSLSEALQQPKSVNQHDWRYERGLWIVLRNFLLWKRYRSWMFVQVIIHSAFTEAPFPHMFQMGMLRLYSHCNALYPGISRRNILRLQPIQNAAAGLLTRTKRSNHFASMRAVLHLLPERFRIDFKILPLVFKPWSVWLMPISVTPDGVRVKNLRQTNSPLLYFFHEFMLFIGFCFCFFQICSYPNTCVLLVTYTNLHITQSKTSAEVKKQPIQRAKRIKQQKLGYFPSLGL